MTALQSPSLLVLAGLLLVGCGGSQPVTVSYDADQNQTTYETRSYTVVSTSGSNYATSKSIEMRAVARCSGENCTPDAVKFFFATSGSEQMALAGLGGQITADGATFEWTGAEAGTNVSGSGADDEMIEVVGTFAVVDLRLDQVRRMASASSLSGSIGGMSLRLDSNVQSGLQELIRKIYGEPSGGGAAGAES